MKVRPRAALVGPPYVWKDARSEVLLVSTLLEQAGVPYDTLHDTDWSALVGGASRYALLIIPGYLEGDAVNGQMRTSLERFAEGGGVVFIMKPMGKREFPEALVLAGLNASTRTNQATHLRIRDTQDPSLGAIDSPEEKVIPLTQDANRAPMDAFVFEPAEKTQVLADAYDRNAKLGAIATKRSVGRGAIYAWGSDLATFDVSRCYMNCFEPAGDVLRLVLREALREGAGGHVLLKHPVSGPYDSALILTHDVQAKDAYQAGSWGEPGALQMAAVEKRHAVRATYNFSTGEFFTPDIVRRVCQDGACDVGAASVRHSSSFHEHPRGTCTEVFETYGPAVPATICGEVRVSRDLLTLATKTHTHAWRSPYLATNAFLFPVLAESGVTLDSSFGVGDLKYNLPVDTARMPKLQHWFGHQPLFEFPIVANDARTSAPGKHEEIQSKNVTWFESIWEYTMLRNAQNASVTTVRISPTRGDGDDSTMAAKLELLEHMIQVARAHRVAIDSLVHFGDFWRARSKVALEADYDIGAGYTGTVRVGDEPIEGLTLEAGDSIVSFECPACGRVEVYGKRIVLRDRLNAGASAAFVAKPQVAAPARWHAPAASRQERAGASGDLSANEGSPR